MISSDAELQQALEQTFRLYQVLAGLRRKHAPGNDARYALMAEGPLDLLQQLQAQIDGYVGMAGLREGSADLWLRIHGPGIELDDAPTSLITTPVDALRKGVQMVAELLDTGSLATRPTKDLMSACDLRLAGLMPGSVQIGLRLPQTAEAEPKARVAQEALNRYLDVASWAASGEQDALAAREPDPQRRKVLLQAVKALVPSKRGRVDFVELRGRSVGPEAVRLTRHAHKRLDEALDRLVEDRSVTRTGVVREIDLDQQTFLLRNGDDPTEIRCSFPDELYEVTKEAFDRQVRVSGSMGPPAVRRGAAVLRVQRIEVVEDASGDDEAGA